MRPQSLGFPSSPRNGYLVVVSVRCRINVFLVLEGLNGSFQNFFQESSPEWVHT